MFLIRRWSFSSGSEGRFAVTGAMSKTFLAGFFFCYCKEASTGEFKSYSFIFSGPSVSLFFPLPPSLSLVVSQAKVVQLPTPVTPLPLT